MITQEDALSIVQRHLLALSPLPDGDNWVVLPDSTIEREFGWVFFYNSRAFLETRNPLLAIAGNGPLLVQRRTGKLEVLGTAHPLEHYIAAYEGSNA